jgi:crossover junction endodeoxyribonuclease RuvC
VSDPPRVILGLDPGIARLGFGLLQAQGDRVQHLEHGCLETRSTAPVPARLRILYDGVRELRSRYAVTDVAMELLFHTRNVSTAIMVGQARGVAMLAAVDDGVNLGEYTPTQVKQVVAGFGGAGKRQMQETIALLLGLAAPPTPDDAADALAIAVCHAQHLQLRQLLATAGAGAR